MTSEFLIFLLLEEERKEDLLWLPYLLVMKGGDPKSNLLKGGK